MSSSNCTSKVTKWLSVSVCCLLRILRRHLRCTMNDTGRSCLRSQSTARRSWGWLMRLIAEQTSLIYQELDTCLIAIWNRSWRSDSKTLFSLTLLFVFARLLGNLLLSLRERQTTESSAREKYVKDYQAYFVILMNCRMRNNLREEFSRKTFSMPNFSLDRMLLGEVRVTN